MKRATLLALALWVTSGGPALAHGTGGGGSSRSGLSFPLVLAGAAVVFAGLATRGQRSRVATGMVVSAGVALCAIGLVSGGGSGDSDRPDVHIAVVEPAAGATVPSGEPITVRVESDGPIASSPDDKEGGHLHLAVDGALQQMPYATEAEVELKQGQHTVTVEYVDHDHVSFDPPIEHSVEVTAR